MSSNSLKGIASSIRGGGLGSHADRRGYEGLTSHWGRAARYMDLGFAFDTPEKAIECGRVLFGKDYV